MNNSVPDYANYSLKELREAWLRIDDTNHPERAIEVYQRIKALEASNVKEENLLDSLPEWVISILRFLYRPPRFYETSFSDVLTEEHNAEMKEERIKKRIAETASGET